jgi:small-conductance mechanosensitive channel
MPRPDPVPPSLERSARAWARYKALMSWMIAAAVVAVGLALLYLKLTGTFLSVHMVVATIAGVFFTVLLGTALMGLAYFSSHSGHDEAAQSHEDEHDLR